MRFTLPSLKTSLKAVAWVLGGVLALFILVLSATNVLLKGNWLRAQINKNPEKTRVLYSEASSSWPGRIRVRNISIRSRDEGVEWIAVIDEARLVVDLSSLVHKRFHVRTLDGAGLSFRIRQRIEAKELDAIAAKTLPPIDGFTDPPMTGPEPPPGDLSKLFKVEIDDLLIEPVKEVWVDGYRYQGGGQLKGGFFLWPRHEGQVFPSTLVFAPGRLDLGNFPVAEPFRGRVTCQIPHFDVKTYAGNEIWKILTGTADLKADVPSLAFLGPALGNPQRPRFKKGEGPLELNVRLRDGAGSVAMKFDFKKTETRWDKVKLFGSIRGAIEIPRVDFKESVADLGGTFVDLKDITVEKGGEQRNWWGKFEMPRGRMDLKTASLATHLAARCRDARPLFAILGVELPGWAQGVLKLDDLKAEAGVRFAPALLDMSTLHATGGAFQIDGRYRKKGNAKRGAFLLQTALLNVGVNVEDSGIGLKLLGAKTWYEESTGQRAKETKEKTAGKPLPEPPTTSRLGKRRSSSPAGSREAPSPREKEKASRTRG